VEAAAPADQPHEATMSTTASEVPVTVNGLRSDSIVTTRGNMAASVPMQSDPTGPMTRATPDRR